MAFISNLQRDQPKVYAPGSSPIITEHGSPPGAFLILKNRAMHGVWNTYPYFYKFCLNCEINQADEKHQVYKMYIKAMIWDIRGSLCSAKSLF